MPTFELIQSEPSTIKSSMSARIANKKIISNNFIAASFDHGRDVVTLFTSADVVTIGIVTIKLMQEFSKLTKDMEVNQRSELCKLLCEECF